MRPALLLLTLPLLASCADAVDTATRARDCVALARDVAAVGLAGVPSAAQAEEGVRRLDERVGSFGDGEVRDAAAALRDRLEDLEQAARTGTAAEVRAAARDAREAAAQAAGACGLPVSQFLGGS